MDLRSGDLFEAKTLDYSDGGISFASDGRFEKGSPLYFGILYPPNYFTSRVIEYYKGKVMWRKDLKESRFRYGYGVQLVSDLHQAESQADDAKTIKESRKHPRRPFIRPLRFATADDVYDGTTQNISASGVFIATNDKLEVGQSLKLNLPLKKGKMVGAVGKVVWVNEEGFGLKFVKAE